MQNSRKISLIALFTAFAVVLSYIESFIPVTGIPGVKLGLANFSIVLAIYLLGDKEGILINFVRILIVGAFFGNLFSISFSLAGAVASYVIMILLKRTGKVSMLTVAITGGVFHNIGQIIVAGFVVDTYGVYTYIPVLIISGIITGGIIGILSEIIYKRTKHLFYKMTK
jgi:heptaprenyl diphosphate synthase